MKNESFNCITPEETASKAVKGKTFPAVKRLQPAGSINEHLRFERLISDISALFVNIASDQIDAEIVGALEQVLEFFQVDRCALLGLSPDLKRVQVSHIACSEGVERVSGDIDLSSLFPWHYERLVQQKQFLCINRLEELPESAVQDRLSCTAMGIRSFINIPLLFEGRVSSLIVLNAVREERSWSAKYIPRLQLLGEIFVNALERRRLAQQLEARLSFEALLSGLSARFINIPAHLIDAEIEEAQRLVCEGLGLERSSLWQWSTENARLLTLTHIFRYAGSPAIPQQLNAAEQFPWTLSQVREGKALVIPSVEDLPEEAAQDKETWRRYGAKSSVIVPLSVGGGRQMGVLTFATVQEECAWPEEVLKRLGLVAQIFANVLARKLADDEISRLKDRLNAENTYLREEIDICKQSETIIGQSDPIKYVHYRISQVASLDSTVMIVGETGTGKGLVARAIHEKSLRSDRPMVHLNCAVLPANLIESELFGREKGAFTGAQARQIGRFELADKCTIFLDEIGELPVELQAKLLRVIESGEFERLGGPHTIKVDVRIIASTNRQLDEEISKGRFREDLFYRLNVFPITVPPLRERSEDIPLLVDALIGRLNKKLGRRIVSVPQEVMRALQSYFWPGNVRELENVIERAVIMSNGPMLQLADQLIAAFRPTAGARETTPSSLVDMERSHIQKTLEALNWKIEGPTGAAYALGLKPSTLRSRMKKLTIHQSYIS